MKRRETEETETLLLDTAARLFRRDGYSATSLRAIADAAGLLLGSLQYRFRTKEALLIALMERGVTRAIAEMSAAIADVRDPRERIRVGLRTHLRMLLSGDDSIYVLLYDWRVLRGAPRRALVKLRDRYDHFWDPLFSAVKPSIDPKMMRLFSFGAINWVATWYRPNGKLSPDQIADLFFTLISEGAIAKSAKGSRRPRR